MSPELDKKLCKKYPNLYKDRHGDMRYTAMCWGFPGDGWYDIIDRLSAKLEPYGVVATQVKEKFGGLRFYISHYPQEACDEIDKAINNAEAESFKTCETCGAPGKRTGGVWIKTLCDKCKTDV